MSERSSPAAGEDRDPSLDAGLHELHVGYTWKFSEAAAASARAERPESPAAPTEADGREEVERLRAQVRHLTTALEDVVAQALSGADYRERAMLMHRRAVAALSTLPGRPAAPPPDET